jgi:hypothetical protein
MVEEEIVVCSNVLSKNSDGVTENNHEIYQPRSQVTEVSRESLKCKASF